MFYSLFGFQTDVDLLFLGGSPPSPKLFSSSVGLVLGFPFDPLKVVGF